LEFYVSKSKLNPFPLVVENTHLVERSQVAEVFAKHLKSLYDNTACKFPSDPITPFDVASSDNLSLFPVTDAEARKAIRLLKPSKSFGFNGIPGFIFESCIGNLVLSLKYKNILQRK
jgi:hypothetical protein